ncbi:MAG TPA: DUF1549 domain-containing protein [Gemmataceae bacterium]|nr:DUF1549 domain-containing protein [Gemmataceae bacterium]
MWRRNLLFLGLIGGGVLALGAGLMLPRQPKPLTRFDASAYRAPDFVAVVRRVDASFRHSWTEQKLPPAPPAPDLTVARRLALGLMCTIPSLEEIRQFEYLPEDQRLPWWIDHILQDRRFADNFAERFARAFVGTEDGPFIFYRRRRFVDWLAEQLAANRPYDRMVRDLIASEGLWTDKPAANFVSVTVQPDNKNQPDPVRLAGRVTRAFLGLRLDCAQCHNHPYAEWKQADFQGLSAFFGQTHLGFTGIYDGPGEYQIKDRKTEEMRSVVPCVPFAADLLPNEGSLRWQLACWITHPKNPYFARAAVNRVWALMLGKPLVEPVDNLESDTPAPPALDLLADDFAAHGFDLRRLIRVIACTEVSRLDSASEHDGGEMAEKAWAVFPLTRLRPDQVVGGVLQASSVATLNAESHILFRLARSFQRNDFVTRYGDSGEDEFDGRGGTIPQRLLMMNGSLLHEKTNDSLFNASRQIGWMAADDAHAVEAAYLSVLTRRPVPEEAEHFQHFLVDFQLSRAQRFEDLFWSLLNSTEFSWNH